MKIPIMSGITAKDGVFATSYPINLEPRALESGVSSGQLVSTRGAITVTTGPGIDRGGIEWNGALYRVMGSRLVRVSQAGVVVDLGDVGTDARRCSFDYSFDRLAIRSGTSLYYYDGAALTQVTDPDLGSAIDMCWMDGYFVTTDGEFAVVTELLDPAKVEPLKYGSAEEDPDGCTGVMKYREELYVFGRHTIQTFQNVGGLNFPFQVVNGAAIPYGCIAANAKCKVAGTFAFIGGGRGEPLGLFVAGNGTAVRISSKEVEDAIAAETTPDLIELEGRTFGEESQLFIHLEHRTIGISIKTSQVADAGAWFVLHSGDFGRYRPRNAVHCYGRLWVGDADSSALGTLSEDTAAHFGTEPPWQFDSALMFADGAGIHAHEVELIGQFPLTPSAVFFSITRDGALWSREVSRRLTGRRDEQVIWRPGVRFSKLGAFRWRGHGRVAISAAVLRADPL